MEGEYHPYLAPINYNIMSRTNKQGIARTKRLQQKSSKIKGLDMQSYYTKIAKQNLETSLNNGDVYKKENKLGHTYHWYRKGRKCCWETGLKCDMDGLDKWGMPCYKLMKRIKKQS